MYFRETNYVHYHDACVERELFRRKARCVNDWRYDVPQRAQRFSVNFLGHVAPYNVPRKPARKNFPWIPVRKLFHEIQISVKGDVTCKVYLSPP